MRGNLEFSFGGLHSKFERYITRCGGYENMDEDTKKAVARALQRSAFRQLEEKVALGLQWCAEREIGVRHLVVSGGVASNLFLRQR